jgi:hypothetical protein
LPACGLASRRWGLWLVFLVAYKQIVRSYDKRSEEGSGESAPANV